MLLQKHMKSIKRYHLVTADSQKIDCMYQTGTTKAA